MPTLSHTPETIKKNISELLVLASFSDGAGAGVWPRKTTLMGQSRLRRRQKQPKKGKKKKKKRAGDDSLMTNALQRREVVSLQGWDFFGYGVGFCLLLIISLLTHELSLLFSFLAAFLLVLQFYFITSFASAGVEARRGGRGGGATRHGCFFLGSAFSFWFAAFGKGGR